MKLIVGIALLCVSAGYVSLGISVLREDYRSLIRRKYSITGFVLALWSFSYCAMTVADVEQVRFTFWAVGLVMSCLFLPSWFVFFAELSQQNSRVTQGLAVTSYTLGLTLALWCVFSNDVTFVSTNAGWQFSYQPTMPMVLLPFFFSLAILPPMFYSFRWYREVELKRLKKESLTFIIIILITGPMILPFDFIVPIFSGSTTVPISSIVVFFSALPLYRIMRSHWSFSLTNNDVSQLLFSTLIYPVIMMNSENSIQLVNPVAVKVWGDDLIGKDVCSLIQVEEQYPASSVFAEEFDSLIATIPSGESTFDLLLRINRDEYGDVISKTLFFSDITDLQNALLAARSASEAKTEFLSRISHELRTPMNAIIGMTSIAKGSNDAEKIDHCLDRIEVASHHLLSLINDILDMSNMDSHKFTLAISSFELDSLLETVDELVGHRAIDKQLNLTYHRDPAIPNQLIGDRVRILQIISHLMSNAIKFTPSGGDIRLSLKMLELINDDLHLHVEVEDTGIGIDLEQQKKLFTPFHQAKKETAVFYEGTGLGLALVKNMVEQMEGRVGVKSELGKGSVFYCQVKLKVKDLSIDENITDPHIWSNLTYSECKLLLAEDNEINQEIALELLNPLGMEIDCALNGQQALEMFCAGDKQYDLILMDIQMPIMDGLQATREIRNSNCENAKGVPILAMTANAFEDDVRACLAAGMNGHISKPIDSALMYQKIGMQLLGKEDKTVK